MEKIVVVIMGQNCEKFIGMCLESVKDADAIVYCDGGSTDDTLNRIDYDKVIVIKNPYDQEDKQMNGKQRNFYLDYVKENYPDYWCLCLDADEVVEDLSKIKEYIQICGGKLVNIKMRHLIGDLAHEDAVTPVHYVLNRLFRISDDLIYPEVEHPVLMGKNPTMPVTIYQTDCTTIWHLAYVPNMWEIKKRYDNHLKKSQMHTPEYLKGWYYSHLFGQYPKSQFNPLELPKIITDEFKIDRDELYFANRGLETKHFLDAIHWKEFFKPKKAIEFGCGLGPRVYALNQLDIFTKGLEISKFAVENSIAKKGSVIQNDIAEMGEELIENYDLAIAYDVLEHIDYDKINTVINNLIMCGKYILISVPFKGTPNCDNDPTHIIKEDRDWWIKKFTDKGLKPIKVPDHFLFREQILIFEK